LLPLNLQIKVPYFFDQTLQLPLFPPLICVWLLFKVVFIL